MFVFIYGPDATNKCAQKQIEFNTTKTRITTLSAVRIWRNSEEYNFTTSL